MKLASTILAAALALPVLSVAATASAQDTPCGNFDFTSGISCEIKVEGGCTAECTPLNFEAGCSGGCTAAATTDCTSTCGTQCIAECDPALLDCFAGCHAECDGEVQAQCEAAHPGEDCVTQAKAQCDMHCETSCEVPPSDCQEHCQSCCTGGCQTQINFDCDYQCFVELSGGCEVQCTEPSGALFCNGQYVYASDVEACINYLATQGITVDVSARGEVTCDLNGCDGEGSANAGICSAAPQGPFDWRVAGGSISALGLVFGLLGARRRNKKA